MLNKAPVRYCRCKDCPIHVGRVLEFLPRFATLAKTSMEPLQPPSSHFAIAAQGWLELGNAKEALKELGQVDRAYWNHPDVLELRWQIHAAEQNWERALMVARDLVHS